MQRGRISAERGDFTQAVAHLDQALKVDGTLVDGWMQLAGALFQLGRSGEAQQALASGVARNPDSTQLRFALGGLHLHQNQPAAAVACIRKVAELEPGNAQAFNMLGIAYQMQGDHAAAAECYQKVASINPADADAQFNLGTAMQALNRMDRAVDCYRQALQIQPYRAEIHNNLGAALLSQDKFAEAIPYLERAAQLDQNNVGACFNLGNALRRQGEFDKAVQVYRRIISTHPRHADAYINLGLMLRDASRYDEAVDCLRQALALSPRNPDLHSNLGAVLEKSGRLKDAVTCYRNAILFDPGHVQALTNLGAALIKTEEIDEAIDCCRKAAAINADYVEAHYSLGRALQARNDHEAAMKSYRTALEIEPGHSDSWTNIGFLLHQQGDIDEAVSCYKNALADSGNPADVLVNLAVAFQDNHRFDEAMASFNQALQKNPACAEARYYRGLLRLLLGDFAGWEDCECRFTVKRPASPPRMFQVPRWHRDIDLRGKSILLHAEQGLGDTLQFARYAEQVAALGAIVYLEVQPPLAALFSDFPGAAKIFAAGDALPAFDYYCPLLSLPFEFKTDRRSIPAAGKYLQAPAEKSKLWAARMPAGPEPRVGIVWSGNPFHKNDRNRSIALASLAALFDVPGLRFYSLQKEVRESDAPALAACAGLIDIAPDLQDFSDTAAAIANLDLVISVDTSVAHLAGALGAPVWILIPFNTDFRWLEKGNDSPWYPSARLFRQARRGDWAGVIDRVRQEISALRMQRGG